MCVRIIIYNRYHGRYPLLPFMLQEAPRNIDATVKRITATPVQQLPKQLNTDSYYALASYTCVT